MKVRLLGNISKEKKQTVIYSIVYGIYAIFLMGIFLIDLECLKASFRSFPQAASWLSHIMIQPSRLDSTAFAAQDYFSLLYILGYPIVFIVSFVICILWCLEWKNKIFLRALILPFIFMFVCIFMSELGRSVF